MSRVSYVMMNPGGDKELTRDGARGHGRADRRGCARGRRRARRNPRGDARRQSDHASSRSRPRSDRARRRAVRADRRLRPTKRGPASSASTSRPAPSSTRCPASPAMSARIPPGVVLAEGPYLKDELTLLVDVGTNAEIVFGNRERLLACSSPTGPAFEGAQISCGQRAAPGAIERVRIDRLTLEPRFKVIGCDLWSDEPGFAEATAKTGVTGVCGSGIIEAIAEMFLAGIVSEDGVIDGALASANDAGRAGRAHLRLCAERGRAAASHLPDRRARDPARQGRALCRREAPDRARRRRARAHHPRRRLRQPHRSGSTR